MDFKISKDLMLHRHLMDIYEALKVHPKSVTHLDASLSIYFLLCIGGRYEYSY